MNNTLHIEYGHYRQLTKEELRSIPSNRKCKLVVTEPYTYRKGNKHIYVPVGFLSDGATGVPDLGASWIFHDYLYDNHKYTSEQPCTRVEADRVLCEVAKHEGWKILPWIIGWTFRSNILGIPNYCWTRAGNKGEEHLQDFMDTDLGDTEYIHSIFN